MPSSPGTEQTSRAFKNVLHLLTRQQWPPSSFWEGQGAEGRSQISSFMSRAHRTRAGCGEGQRWARSAYQANPADAPIHYRVLWHLYGPLAEEEVELVVVALRAVRDELNTDERRVCR